jgi:hypothetical protein
LVNLLFNFKTIVPVNPLGQIVRRVFLNFILFNSTFFYFEHQFLFIFSKNKEILMEKVRGCVSNENVPPTFFRISAVAAREQQGDQKRLFLAYWEIFRQ